MRKSIKVSAELERELENETPITNRTCKEQNKNLFESVKKQQVEEPQLTNRYQT